MLRCTVCKSKIVYLGNFAMCPFETDENHKEGYEAFEDSDERYVSGIRSSMVELVAINQSDNIAIDPREEKRAFNSFRIRS